MSVSRLTARPASVCCSRFQARLTRGVRLPQSRSHPSRWLLRSQGREKERPMRLSTIRLIATLALLILMAPLATAAQQATTVYRIGRLSPGSPRLVAHLWEVFRQGLRELGYVEGQNLVMEDRYAEGCEERLRDLAAE